MTSDQGRFVGKKVGDVDWELIPGMEDALLPLLEELNKPRGGHDRRVYRDDPAGATIFTLKTNRPGVAGELFVKVFSRGGRKLSIGMNSSPASREWKMAFEHGRRGLPVAAHLARGVRRGFLAPVHEYLIQESLTSYEPFEVFFRTTFRPDLPHARPQDKRRVIRDLAGLIRRMHDRGISRPAIEPRNIMAAPRSGGGVKFVFVDLADSFLRKPKKAFSIDDRVLELARFHKSFSPLFSQGYRIRFYREYFARDGLTRKEFQELVKRIIGLSAELSRKQEQAVIREVRTRTHPFFWFDADHCRIFLRKPVYQNSLLEVMEKLEATPDRSRVRVKLVGGASPIELLLIKCGPDHAPPTGQGSCAAWAFHTSAIMEHHGVSHFLVMAAVHKNGDRGGILATMPGRGEYNLAEYLARKVADEFSGLSWDRRFLIRVARFIGDLHELGWHFPEPGGEDIWVRQTDMGTHELRLFNLHHLRRIRPADFDRRLKNLFEFWKILPLSQADGIMLAEEYLRFSRTDAAARKPRMKRFIEWQVESIARAGE